MSPPSASSEAATGPTPGPATLAFRSGFPLRGDLHPMSVTLYRKEPLECHIHWFGLLRQRAGPDAAARRAWSA